MKHRTTVKRWAAFWWFGDNPHILFDGNCMPQLFHKRRECRTWIQEKFGYIKHRKDLRTAPHNWRLPRAVKVSVILETGRP